MNLDVLDVGGREVAREKFLEYRRARLARGNKAMGEIAQQQADEDDMIMKGYREIARGRQVIDIVATIKAGGLTEKTGTVYRNGGEAITVPLPRLAIIRADMEYCHVSTEKDGRVLFYRSSQTPGGGEVRYPIRLPARTFNGLSHIQLWTGWRAMVPHIPPVLRPADKIGNYHILFEAEWEQTAPPPPRDPALLKHIGGDLYAVLAVWDLTPLEMSVLGRRR